MYKENNKGPRTVPRGTPGKTAGGSVCNNSLLPVTQKRINPFQCFPTYAIAKQFAVKELVRWGIECLLKSNMNVSTCPPLSKMLAQSFITVVN